MKARSKAHAAGRGGPNVQHPLLDAQQIASAVRMPPGADQRRHQRQQTPDSPLSSCHPSARPRALDRHEAPGSQCVFRGPAVFFCRLAGRLAEIRPSIMGS